MKFQSTLRSARPDRRIPTIEELEARTLLSATSLIAEPDAVVLPAAASAGSIEGYTPQQIRQAYSFAGLSFATSKGSVAADGSGETIAIVDAYNDKTIGTDLAAFDSKFGLAAANLTVLNQTGGTSLTTATDSGWATETSLDVEWAHAIAPGAKIVLVQANSGSLSDLLAAVKTAAGYSGVSVVSMSWGSSEFYGETADDSYFTTPSGHIPVTFVAASGDNGAGVEWPSSSPDVIAVGGTTLNINSSNNYASETAWSDGGGGVSAVESATSAQKSVTGERSRTSPDVAYDANPNTGYAIYVDGSWEEVGGTSAGAPQWAALVAIADQGRVASGETTLGTAAADTALYQAPSADFHDVSSGSNGYAAKKGYDLATGIGTPIANDLIPYLVRYTPGTTSGSGSSGNNGGKSSGLGGSGPIQSPLPPRAVWWQPFRGPGLFAGRYFAVPTSAPNVSDALAALSLAEGNRADSTFSLLGAGRLDLTTAPAGNITVNDNARTQSDGSPPRVFDAFHYQVARTDVGDAAVDTDTSDSDDGSDSV